MGALNPKVVLAATWPRRDTGSIEGYCGPDARLGNASILITLDTYSHVLPGFQEAAALRFEEGLFNPSPEREKVKVRNS